jgi:hypothetical protein
VAFAIAGITTAYSQTDNVTETMPKEKVVDNFVGVQMNQLIRQVLNFSSASSTVSNPYLLTYNLRFHKSGWGLRFGAGYNYTSNTTDDGTTKTISKLNDMSFRLGVEKSFILAKRWTAGAGIDITYANNDDRTTTTVRSSFDSSTTDTHTLTPTYGGGVMGWLRYAVAKNVYVGTETSFYYTSGTQKQDVSITNNNFGFPVTTTTHNSNDISQGNISVPVVFYLILRF